VRPQTNADFFARVRYWSATLLFLAGLLGIIGSFLDWVSIEPPPRLPTGEDFEGNEFGEEGTAEPFTGVEAGDGWFVVGASAVLILAAAFLVLGKRTGWLAFLATLLIGAIAISIYRQLSEPTSGLMERMNVFGEADPNIGLTLVAVSAVAGLIGSVIAISATPRRATIEEYESSEPL
jgi:hypothetical protein